MRPDERAAPTPASMPWGLGGNADDPWFFCVRLLGERYAFEAKLALEVVRLGPLTRLPAAPSFLPGVFNHRGEILAVLDAAELLGERPTSIANGARAVIVQSGPWRLALIAEGVEGLTQIPADRLESAPAAGGGGPAEYLSRVGRDEKGNVAILDLERLVDVARARSVPA